MRWRSLTSALVGLLGLTVPVPVAAHEIRPAYLQIDEIGPGRYQLLWRTPVLSGMHLPVVLRLPAGVSLVSVDLTVQLEQLAFLVQMHGPE